MAIAVVTGANGFVGSHLVDLLLEKKFEVRCLIRKTSNLKWLEGKNVQIINSGLQDKTGLRKAFENAEYIFHVAGVVKSKTKEGYFEGNVENTKALLDTALEFKDTIKRFLIVSSQTAVGPSKKNEIVNEETPCNPITTYGRSKLAQEKLAESYMDKIPITICRATAVYGERDTEIFIFFKTFNKGLMTQVGFDKKEVCLLHVIDLVNGLYLAAVSEKAADQIYFISSEKFYTWEEIGNVTSKVMGKKAVKVKIPHFIVFTIAAIAQFFALSSKKPATLNIEKAKDLTQSYWTCDTSKAIRDFGYHQNILLEEGIRRTVDWYKKKNWL